MHAQSRPVPAANGEGAARPVSTSGSGLAPISSGHASVAGPTEELPPEPRWADLPTPGFEPALVWHRRGAPLLVVTHGAGGHAEWHCQQFHRLLGGRASLLCPRGKLRYAGDPSQGYYYPDHLALRREVLATIAQFEATSTEAAGRRPYAYAGYSQGATMGALAFAEHGELFSRLLLVEGGYAEWSTSLVNHFQKSGGKAVLIVCGTKGCNMAARTAAERMTAAGLRARAVWAAGAGHVADGAVGKMVADHWTFLFDDDPRWQGFTPVRVD